MFLAANQSTNSLLEKKVEYKAIHLIPQFHLSTTGLKKLKF